MVGQLALDQHIGVRLPASQPPGFDSLSCTLIVRNSLAVVLICAAALAQQPRIDSFSPPQGPIAGGTIVTITGANFTGGAVMLDRTTITPLSLSDSELRLQMPAHDNGYGLLIVKNGTDSAYARYLYVPPALRDLAPGYITTIAGVGTYAGEYTAATSATIDPMTGAFFNGETFIAQPAPNRVIRITRDGLLIPFAGNGFSTGPLPPNEPTDPLSVAINFPRAIAFDAQGNAYIGDSSYRLWRVDHATGLIQSIAGTGQSGNAGEAVAAKGATIGLASFVAAERDGTVYFIDFSNARVRRISSDGILTTYLGTGTYGFSGDGGPATQAQFNLRNSDEGALALDADGNLFLADTGNDRIRRVDKRTGIISSLPNTAFEGVALREPRGVAASAGGAIAFTSGPQVFEYLDGQVVHRYGSTQGFSDEGTPIDTARFSFTPAVAFDPEGNLVVSDVFNRRVWRLNQASGRLETIAGIGPAILNESGRAIEAVLAISNSDIAVTSNGDLLLADSGNSRIRRIDHEGTISTVSATFDGPTPSLVRGGTFGASSVDVAADQSVDFAAFDSTYVLSTGGVLRRTAGNGSGQCRFTGDDGPALSADLCQAWDVTRDAAGNLVIADTNNNRVRKVDHLSGLIRTIAGSGAPNGNEGYGQGTSCGDGGAAIAACINTPYGVTYDDRGNLFISENEERIRRVDAIGIVSTFAEGRISKMTFWHGYLYALTATNLMRFRRDGSSTSLAGIGALGFSGDGGPATAARLFAQKQSAGVAVDAEGNVYFTDGDNLRVRAIRYGAVLAPPDATIRALAEGSTIRATVLDSAGEPAEGVRVDFTAPASGPSCHFPNNGNAIGVETDANGVATTSCLPNCSSSGSFVVTARPLTASASATVTMSDVAGPCRRRAVRH